MATSKKSDDTQRSAQELLEARVDAMMGDAATTAEPSSAPPLNSSVEASLPQELADIAVATDAPVEPAIEATELDTPQSDAAIDDIVAQEADEVIAAEDAGLAQAEPVEPPQPKGHPIFWFIIFMLVILVIIAGVMLVNPNLQLPFSA